MLKKLFLALVCLGVLTSAVSQARAESALDFKLVNKTGYGIKAIHIGPSSQKEWGDNILPEPLGDGESVDIEFQPKAANIAKWDLLVSWEDPDDPDVYWIGYKLAEITTITLKYDANSNKTSAVVE
ncbi:MAG: hypothetical protein ABW221_03245 [Vicinamibacteria bacterium]